MGDPIGATIKILCIVGNVVWRGFVLRMSPCQVRKSGELILPRQAVITFLCLVAGSLKTAPITLDFLVKNAESAGLLVTQR